MSDEIDHFKIILTSFSKSTPAKQEGRHHQLHSHARMRTNTCTLIGIYVNIHSRVGSCLMQNINMAFSTIHNEEETLVIQLKKQSGPSCFHS